MNLSAISTVNWIEVVQRSLERGVNISELREQVDRFEVTIVSLDVATAEDAARLREPTRHLGLSLGDRACLALARATNATVVTADRAWTRLDVGVRIDVTR